MEQQRKSKRAEKGEASRADDKKMKRKRRAVEEVVGADQADPPPTEEEVDEFFAILKRIRVAVKYFEKAAASSNCKDGGANGQEHLTAGEVAAGGDDAGGKTVVENSDFDLNAVPGEE